ncbi:MAG: sulfatase [bacterium]|nr:sulfatase [bacterium]
MRILFLDLDTLRADHLGCYGYHRNTSPNIDLVAADGVRFDNYYCPDAPCLPSRAALITGRFGIHTGVVGHGGTTADLRLEGPRRGFHSFLNHQQLFYWLAKQAGLRTVSVSPFAERHSAWWFTAGCVETYNTGRGGMESAEEVTPVALDWIERNATQDNWLLHINYWDPHTPYRAPADFGNPFQNDPLPGWLTPEVVAEHVKAVGPHTAREIQMYHSNPDPKYPRHPGEILDMDGLRRMIDGYDCGIAYMDGHIGRIFKALEKKGVMDDLAIIITSDHGENQGELAIYGEHATADHGTCRIPMIVRWPGGRKRYAGQGLHYNLDLLPTLAELLGKPAMPGWDGKSYAAAIRPGGDPDCGHENLVISQCAHVCQRSVRWGDWLYMRTYHDGYHLFPDEMLFNLKDDPHEQHNLATERRDLCLEGVYRLNQWHDDMMKTMPYDVDPLWTVIREGGPFHTKGFLPAYVKRLEATGRGWAVEELKKRHPYEFK